MTCQDCINNDTCLLGKVNCRDDIEDCCDMFKNRSLFVELPCKVGDTVYIYNPDLIYDPSSVVKAKVLSIQLNSNNEIMILLYDEECDRFSIDKNTFIKSVKFTRKEAEQALKETNNKK